MVTWAHCERAAVNSLKRPGPRLLLLLLDQRGEEDEDGDHQRDRLHEHPRRHLLAGEREAKSLVGLERRDEERGALRAVEVVVREADDAAEVELVEELVALAAARPREGHDAVPSVSVARRDPGMGGRSVAEVLHMNPLLWAKWTSGCFSTREKSRRGWSS